ncbi:MAG: type II secretion system protein [Proteobacteria bacterium]|nr:type II secretion system protein [Pseudomonadota bacterium]
MKIKLPAFSLFEVALVLMILGTLMGLGFPLLKTMMEKEKISITQENQKQIMYALASYLLQHYHLPCPSKIDGIAVEQCSRFHEGLVPFKTLGMPENVAKDGYKRWFTYVVNPLLCDTTITSLMPDKREKNDIDISFSKDEKYWCEIKDNYIDLLDQKGESVTKDPIAVLLISHGQSGTGAYNNGNRLLSTTSFLKEENYNGDTKYKTSLFSLDPKNFFDDLILWTTKNNLLAFYAKTPCIYDN